MVCAPVYVKRGNKMTDDNSASAVDDNASDVVETPDVSVYEAKILELTGVIESSNATISALQAEVNATKAANYDLLMALPANDGETVKVDANEADADIDIDDLFEIRS